MKKHFNIRVSGKVQGVFFRASAKEMADALGITGLVRNEHDGDVYVEAEGDQNALDEFVQWCHEGPARAHVSGCHVTDGPVKSFSTFQIER